MAVPGGGATIDGVEYQLWFTAYKLGNAFWDPEVELLIPEARLVPAEPGEEDAKQAARIIWVDDLFIKSSTGDVYYSLKQKDSEGSWTVGQLKLRGVWQQFWKQHCRTPKARLEFVTQSGIENTLYECLLRVRNARNQTAATDALGAEKYVRMFNTVCQLFSATPEQVLFFLQRVYLTVYPEADLRAALHEKFRGRVTNAEFVAAELRTAAGDWAKSQRQITRQDIFQRLRESNCIPTSDFTQQELKEQFRLVSAELEALSNELPIESPFRHIKRIEVDSLVRWAQQPLPEKREGAPLCVLVGTAGTGKSAIMKDLLLGLRQKGQTVLGLKADRLQEDSLADLHRLIRDHGLKDSLEKALATLGVASPPPVILIDQLDALSQNLSANRRPLNSYNALIKQLKELPVRIVISCRPFDLSTDPLLVSYQNKESVTVGLLKEVDVATIVGTLGLDLSTLTSALRTLLRTPLHLRVFCKIRPFLQKELGSLQTVQDLYRELYDLVVMRCNREFPAAPVSPPRLQKLLNKTAKRMYEQQRLVLPHSFGKDEYADELSYLFSQGILVQTPEGVSCFHQSFFDYLYARQFVRKGVRLSDSLAAKHQGLFVRSRTQQVLAYSREADYDNYLVELRELLTDRFLFHIQLVVVYHLASLAEPYGAEFEIVEQLILPHSERSAPFWEVVQPEPWFNYLRRKGWLRQLALQAPYQEWSTIARAAFWSLASHHPDLFVEVVAELPEFEGKAAFLARHSFKAKCFDNPTFQWLFEQYAITIREKDAFTFAYVLDEAAKVAPAWALKVLWAAITEYPKPIGGVKDDERSLRGETFANAYTAAPDTAFDYGKRLLEYWVEKHHYQFQDDTTQLVGGNAFSSRVPTRKRENDPKPQVYSLVRNHLQRQAKAAPEEALQHIQAWLVSPYLTLRQMAADVLWANPLAYLEQVTALLSSPQVLHNRDTPQHLKYVVRRLLHRCYPRFSVEQRTQVNRAILHTLRNPPFEKVSLAEQEHPYRFVESYCGYTTIDYLESIPVTCRAVEPSLRSLHEKLYARYGARPNKQPKGSGVRWGGEPSPLRQRSSAAAGKVDWVNLLRVYVHRSIGSRRHKWELDSLDSHLQAEVEKYPELLLPTLQSLLADAELPKKYALSALEGLTKSDLAPTVVRNILLDACLHDWMEDYDRSKLLKYAVEKNVANLAVAQVFADVALRNAQHQPDEKSRHDLVHEAINCVGGRAARELILCLQEETTRGFAFETLERLATVANAYVRAAVAYYVAEGLRFDRFRTIQLFKIVVQQDTRITRIGHEVLVRLTIPELLPFIPQQLSPYYLGDDFNFFVSLLTHAWYWGFDEGLQTLESCWELDEEAQVTSARYLLDDYSKMHTSGKAKAQLVFEHFLPSENEKLQRAYEHAFADFAPDDFVNLYPLLRRYVTSPVGKGRQAEFYNYLLKNVQDYPEECFELMRPFTTHALPDIQRNSLEKEPVDFILQVYNRLTQRRVSEEVLDNVLEVFDGMLRIPAYRASAQERLQTLDG